MSHNRLSAYALRQLSEGLCYNSKLTDFFFTHNDLQENKLEALEFIKSFSNKKELRSLAMNSCNLNGELLTELKNSI